MKTALALLGYEDMRITHGFGITDLETVARRARSEVIEEAVSLINHLLEDGEHDLRAARTLIRAIKVVP